MLNVVICEDDFVCSGILMALLEKYQKRRMEAQEEKMQIFIYASGKAYKEDWELGNEADILLLDIEMAEMDGIQLKEFLEEQESSTKILFTTSHIETMQEAFGANVYGFLPKPIEEEKLFFYLDKICRDVKYEMGVVFVNDMENRVIKLYQIWYIEADGRYSRIKLKNSMIFSGKSLADWEGELDKSCFFRVHKSYLVNFKQITRIADEVIFINGDRIPVARRKKNALKEAYKKFLIRSVL